MTFDPRLTPARADLAAASLRGEVEADCFVEGTRFSVLADVADLKRSPRPDAPLDTQLLHGEIVTVYEDDNGWGWAQADRGRLCRLCPDERARPRGTAGDPQGRRRANLRLSRS